MTILKRQTDKVLFLQDLISHDDKKTQWKEYRLRWAYWIGLYNVQDTTLSPSKKVQSAHSAGLKTYDISTERHPISMGFVWAMGGGMIFF